MFLHSEKQPRNSHITTGVGKDERRLVPQGRETLTKELMPGGSHIFQPTSIANALHLEMLQESLRVEGYPPPPPLSKIFASRAIQLQVLAVSLDSGISGSRLLRKLVRRTAPNFFSASDLKHRCLEEGPLALQLLTLLIQRFPSPLRRERKRSRETHFCGH